MYLKKNMNEFHLPFPTAIGIPNLILNRNRGNWIKGYLLVNKCIITKYISTLCTKKRIITVVQQTSETGTANVSLK